MDLAPSDELEILEMNHKTTISIFIPALNEEKYLERSIQMILSAVGDRFADFEILLFDDGSSDLTGQIADDLATQNEHMRVFHNPQRMGVGYNYFRAIAEARMEYFTWTTGDAITIYLPEDLERLFDAVGKADIVVYYNKSDARPFFRRMLSHGYPMIMNLLFGLNLRYYHGINVYKTAWMKNARIITEGVVSIAEMLIRAIRAGQTYVEVGMNNRDDGKNSKQVQIKNFIEVGKNVCSLWWELQIKSLFSRKSLLN